MKHCLKQRENNRFKFRVWDVKNKKVLPESYFAILGNGKLIVTLSGYYNDFTNTNQDDYVIQQYTGLTDINDKEIYEGDIIHLKFGELNANLVVKWDKYMGLKYHNGGWTSLVHVDTHGEVIGNIFENAELPN